MWEIKFGKFSIRLIWQVVYIALSASLAYYHTQYVAFNVVGGPLSIELRYSFNGS